MKTASAVLSLLLSSFVCASEVQKWDHFYYKDLQTHPIGSTVGSTLIMYVKEANGQTFSAWGCGELQNRFEKLPSHELKQRIWDVFCKNYDLKNNHPQTNRDNNVAFVTDCRICGIACPNLFAAWYGWKMTFNTQVKNSTTQYLFFKFGSKLHEEDCLK